MNINEKDFILIKRGVQNFVLYLNNFYAKFSLRLNLYTIALVADFTSAMAELSTINIKKIRIIINKFSLLEKITQTISLKFIRLTVIIKETLKVASTINVTNIIYPTAMLWQFLITPIRQKLIFTATALLAQFNSLSDFDPLTLGDLNAETLGDMDYTEV